ncbi:hypothetical protein ERJ77_18935, partial [Vibrio anguillarum]|nr:hypothetical protein [Vibrio anguillarum]
MLNIVAMAVMFICLSFTGGRSLLSGMFTANIATGISKYMPVRILLGFGLLMPTSAGVQGLDAYNLVVSNIQANTIRLVLAGGAMADATWQITGRALFDFNIGGAPTLRNTISRSNNLARSFVCAKFYHEGIGKAKGEAPIYVQYLTDGDADARSAFTPLNSINEFLLRDATDVEQTAIILFGGKRGVCGFLPLDVLPSADAPQSKNKVLFPQVNEFIPKIQSAMRDEGNQQFITLLSGYEQFAKSYYENLASMSVASIQASLQTDEEEGTRFDLLPVNLGGLPSHMPNAPLNTKLNGLADGLVTLSQRMAYVQQSVAFKAMRGLPKQLGGSDDLATNLDALSPMFFDKFLSGYVSAGMFWSIYQDFSSLSYEAERYVNDINVTLPEINSATMCDKGFFSRVLSKITDGDSE